MKHFLPILLLCAGCAAGRVRTPTGVVVEGIAIGHAKLEWCPTPGTTTTATTTSTPETTVTTTSTPTETTTSTTLNEHALIEGGALSNSFMETVGLLTTLGSTIFLHWPF